VSVLARALATGAAKAIHDATITQTIRTRITGTHVGARVDAHAPSQEDTWLATMLGRLKTRGLPRQSRASGSPRSWRPVCALAIHRLPSRNRRTGHPALTQLTYVGRQILPGGARGTKVEACAAARSRRMGPARCGRGGLTTDAVPHRQVPRCRATTTGPRPTVGAGSRPHENARRNLWSGSAPPVQAPASPEIRSFGPSGQDLQYRPRLGRRYPVIHEFRGAGLRFTFPVHRPSTKGPPLSSPDSRSGPCTVRP
jgi:hypothetical protein